MVKWLAEDYGFTPGDAYLYLGQVLEARVTQLVNPTFTYLLKGREEAPAPKYARVVMSTWPGDGRVAVRTAICNTGVTLPGDTPLDA